LHSTKQPTLSEVAYILKIYCHSKFLNPMLAVVILVVPPRKVGLRPWHAWYSYHISWESKVVAEGER